MILNFAAGSLIKHQLVSHLTLGIALRVVLDALRKSVDSKVSFSGFFFFLVIISDFSQLVFHKFLCWILLITCVLVDVCLWGQGLGAVR